MSCRMASEAGRISIARLGIGGNYAAGDVGDRGGVDDVDDGGIAQHRDECKRHRKWICCICVYVCSYAIDRLSWDAAKGCLTGM